MERPAALIASVSGARGVVGEGLTVPVASGLAAALGTLLGPGTIVVGRDSRVSGPVMQDAVVAGLRSVGCDATVIGVVATPTVQNMVRELGGAGGIAVTASHNPADWNALKFIGGDGCFLLGDAIAELLRVFDEDRFAFRRYDGLGRARTDDSATERHLTRILALPYLDRDAVQRRKLRVVVDCANGAGGVILPELCRRLGAEVVEMHCQPTGLFARGPEPVAGHLHELCARVVDLGADVGLATDPDVDRLSLVTGAGRALGEELTLPLAAQFVLKRTGGGAIVTNVSTSMAIEAVAQRFGGTVHRTPVGEAHVVDGIRRHQAVIGGEGNGGVILPAVGLARDASTGAAIVLQHLTDWAGTLESLAETIPRTVMVKAKLPAGSVEPDRIAARLADEQPDGRIDRTDGVKVLWESSWVHLRRSNTEPIIRVIAEARESGEAQRLVERAIALGTEVSRS
ncbi:MAG: phosphoglucosamine mutase [Candidatus Eiseniibacteriota bacterium]|jgi:phosphomannomutase